ncbi:MAG: DsrE family protein [Cyclobacteriaceae bacterium]
MKTPIFLVLYTFSVTAFTQEMVSPIVKGFGAIYALPDAAENPDPTLKYQIVIDLKSGTPDASAVNPALNNIARMLNLHGAGGVENDNIKVVGVIHNMATHSILTNAAYQEKYEMDNPNIPLIKALKDAGVELFVCGQSMVARGVANEDLNPDIVKSISALTVMTTYQMRGYKPLVF